MPPDPPSGHALRVTNLHPFALIILVTPMLSIELYDAAAGVVMDRQIDMATIVTLHPVHLFNGSECILSSYV